MVQSIVSLNECNHVWWRDAGVYLCFRNALKLFWVLLIIVLSIGVVWVEFVSRQVLSYHNLPTEGLKLRGLLYLYCIIVSDIYCMVTVSCNWL